MSDRKIISKDFLFLDKAHLPLNGRQVSLRDAVRKKIEDGTYRLEYRSCLCGSADAAIISETDRYALGLKTVICKTCGMLRTNPRLDADSLREFYRREYQDLYFDTASGSLAAHFQAQRTNGLYIRDFIEARHKGFRLKGKSVLEIGCSAGGILMSLLEAGASVRGYDYNERYLEYGKSFDKGLDLRHGGIDDTISLPDRFDLVIMNHVLEHLAEPREAVQAAFGLLKDGGVFYLSVPGIKNARYYNSPTRSYLGSLHIAHLYHFTRGSLGAIMDNFEPVFVDDDVRGIFRRAPGRRAWPFPREYENNLKYIMRRENSLPGCFRKKADVLLHGHNIYTRAMWIGHCLRKTRNRWICGR